MCLYSIFILPITAFLSFPLGKHTVGALGNYSVYLSFPCAAVCHVLYGTRLGLLEDFIDPEAQKFIDAVTLMFQTTAPMLYIPPSLLRKINAKTWLDHVRAWDIIFMQGGYLHSINWGRHPYETLKDSPSL